MAKATKSAGPVLPVRSSFAMLCVPVLGSSAVPCADCTYLQEELLLQLQGPALVQVRQGCQVPNVSTLQGDLQAAAHEYVTGTKANLACIISRALAGAAVAGPSAAAQRLLTHQQTNILGRACLREPLGHDLLM